MTWINIWIVYRINQAVLDKMDSSEVVSDVNTASDDFQQLLQHNLNKLNQDGQLNVKNEKKDFQDTISDTMNKLKSSSMKAQVENS